MDSHISNWEIQDVKTVPAFTVSTISLPLRLLCLNVYNYKDRISFSHSWHRVSRLGKARNLFCSCFLTHGFHYSVLVFLCLGLDLPVHKWCMEVHKWCMEAKEIEFLKCMLLSIRWRTCWDGGYRCYQATGLSTQRLSLGQSSGQRWITVCKKAYWQFSL